MYVPIYVVVGVQEGALVQIQAFTNLEGAEAWKRDTLTLMGITEGPLQARQEHNAREKGTWVKIYRFGLSQPNRLERYATVK